MLNIITIYHVTISRRWHEHVFTWTCMCLLQCFFAPEHKNCLTKCSLILKLSIAAILFPRVPRRKTSAIHRVFLLTVRKISAEEKIRKTDSGNTDKFLALKIFLRVLRKVGNPSEVYCIMFYPDCIDFITDLCCLLVYFVVNH